jgi:hypothetical protein
MKSYHLQVNGWNQNIILSEVSQAQKTKNHVLPHMQTLDGGQMQQCGWTWITRQQNSNFKYMYNVFQCCLNNAFQVV